MKVGLQTYSVREHMAADVTGTLETMAQLGYRYFEVANHSEGKPYQGEDIGIGFGIGPTQISELMHRLQAEIVGVHLFPFPFEADKLAAMLEYHKILGTRYVVVPNAFYDGRDAIQRMCEKLQAAGEMCKREGFALLYHNHFHEYQKFDGKTVLDHLMEGTDPDVVGLEFDTVWAYMAGVDPVDTMRQYGERVRVIHQKDYAKHLVAERDRLAGFKDDEDYIDLGRMIGCFDKESFCEIGTGVMDIQEIINVGNEVCKSEYIILEQDYTTLGELESVEVSMRQFKKYSGIEW